MKFQILTSALVATTSAAALATTPKTFALKTTSSDSRFNDLCVEAYHTGAGLADAVLSKCIPKSSEFYMNGTMIGSTAFGAADVAGFYAEQGSSYDDWFPATITSAYGGNFTYSKQKGFLSVPYGSSPAYGFLACEWSHGGAPQLFVLGYQGNATKVIETCAFVKLVKG